MVAIITPFTQEGDVDFKAFENLIRWHVQSGSDGIVCCGTTGESPTLTEKEKLDLLQICIQNSKGKIPVIMNTGTNDTRSSVRLTQEAKKLGADAALAIVPYYNRPTMEGCFAHFQEMDRVGLPLILYHHPKRTGTLLSLETIQKIGALPSVYAIKEASSDLSLAKQIKESCEIAVLSGDDSLTPEMMKMGCSGCISVIGNLIPKEYREIIQTFQRKDFKKADVLHEKYRTLIDCLSLETNPQCIKYAVFLSGKCHSTFRLPLLEPGSKTKEKIAIELTRLKLI